MWIPYNENPKGRHVGDCTVRAITKATGKDWYEVYAWMALQGFVMCDMPSANAVWGAYLRHEGWKRRLLPDECPDCYTLSDFCRDNPVGTYIVAFGTHVVAVVDGDWYDTWDSGNEIPIYYFCKED